MGLSRLAEQCRKCPFKDNCKNKRIEALGYLPEPIVAEAGASSAAELTQPILRETVNTIIDGKVVKVYKDEIENITLYKAASQSRSSVWRLIMESNNKNSLGYEVGQALAFVIGVCIAAILVALTVKLILWIL